MANYSYFKEGKQSYINLNTLFYIIIYIIVETFIYRLNSVR
jgi:hypothetical protein